MIRYPPIAALRAFESASRHLNYTKAAQELHVTQSAISHQIKHIEELWGFRLFKRKGRSIQMTDEALRIAPVVRQFFEQLNDSVQFTYENMADEGYLQVALSQSFALKWMVPRLGDFSHQYPDIDVTISTLPTPAIADFEQADIVIMYSDGVHPEYNVIPLLYDYSFPVCAPDFFENEISRLKTPQDLLKLPLLRRLKVDAAPRWSDWFAKAGFEVHTLPKGIQFPNSSMALQAAIDGQGVALGRSSHVADDLSSGRLVKLFDIYARSSHCYNLIVPQEKLHRLSVQDFTAWIKDEALVSQELFDAQAKAKGRVK